MRQVSFKFEGVSVSCAASIFLAVAFPGAWQLHEGGTPSAREGKMPSTLTFLTYDRKIIRQVVFQHAHFAVQRGQHAHHLGGGVDEVLLVAGGAAIMQQVEHQVLAGDLQQRGGRRGRKSMLLPRLRLNVPEQKTTSKLSGPERVAHEDIAVDEPRGRVAARAASTIFSRMSTPV